MRFIFLVAVSLASCSAPSPWHLETVENSESAYCFEKLSHALAQQGSLCFEIFSAKTEVGAFLSLPRHKFSPSLERNLLLEVNLGEEKILEKVFILEGNMRLKLPEALTKKIILALEQEQEVSFSIDGFKEKITPLSKKQIEKISWLR